MTTRRDARIRWHYFAVLWAAGLAMTTVGCASGKGGWFGSKKPEPPQTIASFLNQPRPK
ncbi:MAG TPA: hypothetical protein VJ783_02135 [Pirellulales bacterium]|nr:hypothetical protein [Pirellulales bacterium]